MSAPSKNGGHGLTFAVATQALREATELEAEAHDLDRRASEKRAAAATLRAMHAIASLAVPPVALMDDEAAA